MKALRRFLKRLAASATTEPDDERLREELEAHVAMQAAEYHAPARQRRTPGGKR